MINIDKSYLKIWKVEDKGNCVKATTTTGKKDKRTDTWVNSNWIVTFVGECLNEAKNLKEGDKVTVLNGIIENVWDKEKSRNWLNVVVFKIECDENNTNATMQEVIDEDDDPLPF